MNTEGTPSSETFQISNSLDTKLMSNISYIKTIEHVGFFLPSKFKN